MSRKRLWLGLAAAAGAAVAGHVTSAVLGSRPDGVGSDGPLAPCGPDLNCYRSRRAVAGSPEAALAAAEAHLRTRSGLTGRAVTVERTPEGVRAVVQVGPFRDDVAVAAEGRAGGAGAEPGATLYVRSASRTGRSDLGVNRARGRRLLDAVEAELEAQAEAAARVAGPAAAPRGQTAP